MLGPAMRPMLIFVSDIHLTDQLRSGAVSKADLFDRFWVRIQAARGDRPAQLVFVGDVFDIVRSPRWLRTMHRPYHAATPQMIAVVEQIVDDILARETEFTARIRAQVESGALQIRYVLGNHDRLLAHAPNARRKIWRAFTGRDEEVEFPGELVFPEHGVLAFHGHRTDFICHEPDGGPPIGDAIGIDLIVRFPDQVRERASQALPELDDIDDVRPVFAVPAWVRAFGAKHDGLLPTVAKTWRDVVDDFFSTDFVGDWMRSHRRIGFSEATKLKLLLTLSTSRMMKKTSDHKLAQLYRFFQHMFDGRFAARAAALLTSKEHRGLRYVVNGHSHFASMVPLGQIDGKPACYFNTGTWRTVHQMGRLMPGQPAFLPYESMSYLVFFPEGDPMGRDFEWWTGAMVPAEPPTEE
jgi:UDP-2,3-diacylglucosamine pyrophosphatase LpxH